MQGVLSQSPSPAMREREDPARRAGWVRACRQKRLFDDHQLLTSAISDCLASIIPCKCAAAFSMS